MSGLDCLCTVPCIVLHLPPSNKTVRISYFHIVSFGILYHQCIYHRFSLITSGFNRFFLYIRRAVCIALWLSVMNTFHLAYTLKDKQSIILKCMLQFWDYLNQLVVKTNADFSYSYKLKFVPHSKQTSPRFQQQNVRDVRSRVQTFPVWHSKAAPNRKCCEGYIVPSMVRLMYQLKSVLK